MKKPILTLLSVLTLYATEIPGDEEQPGSSLPPVGTHYSKEACPVAPSLEPQPHPFPPPPVVGIPLTYRFRAEYRAVNGISSRDDMLQFLPKGDPRSLSPLIMPNPLEEPDLP